MDHQPVIDELITLPPLRVQKIYGLYHTVLVLELYSPPTGRLYLVFDQNPSTLTLHLQPKRPAGTKTSNQVVSLLNKYLTSKWIQFFKLDEEGDRVFFNFDADEKNFCLLFEFFPAAGATIFCQKKFFSTTNKKIKTQYRSGKINSKQEHTDLKNNFARAKIYFDSARKHYQKIFFNNRAAQLKKQIAKKKKLLRNVSTDLAKCEKNLFLQHDAELLRANFYLLKRGMKEIELTDYTIDPPTTRTIALDERLAPKDQLENIFKKIKRAKRGHKIITDRIKAIKKELDSIEVQADAFMNAGPDAVDPQSFDEMVGEKKAAKKKASTRLPFRTYLSSDKIKILVGRSAKDSDELTLRHAKGNDWWFHARDVAGAHVVAKCNSDQLPNATMLEAAMLAAHFSKLKSDPRPVVQYTRAKNVRKKKGLLAGKVIVTGEKTIEIEMDQRTLTMILQNEER